MARNRDKAQQAHSRLDATTQEVLELVGNFDEMRKKVLQSLIEAYERYQRHSFDVTAQQLAKPIEHLHAWWAGFASSCRANDRDAIEAWVKHALTTQVTFDKATKDDSTSMNAMQFREDLKTDYEVMRCTPLLRVIHFAAFKHKCELVQGKLSAAKLGSQYIERLTLAPSSEKVTSSWVGMVTTISDSHRRLTIMLCMY